MDGAPEWAQETGRNVLIGGNVTFSHICLSPPPYPPQMPPPPMLPATTGCPCITAFPANTDIYTDDNLNIRVNVLGDILRYPLTCASTCLDPSPCGSCPLLPA